MGKPPLIEIIYEDDYLVIANKPSGLLTVPSPRREAATLTSRLNAQLKGSLGERRLRPCHRLDRETSGLIIYAKGEKPYRLMAEQFKLRKVHKKYIAFVRGSLQKTEGAITKPVPETSFGSRRAVSKSAVTKYKLLEERKGFSVVEVTPITGRTNQIRIHFSGLGNPLLGERIYAFGRDFPVKFRRVALHSAELRFAHPLTGKEVRINSPLPNDMISFLEAHS
jgi:23S rRNA pseudouridine1911/1915/1917 synthase